MTTFRQMIVRSAVAAAALVVATAGVAAAATPASATPTQFAAQVSAAHLTSAQAAGLQAKVDAYVAKSGGKQVAANEVAVPGGDVLFVVPGQKIARSLAAPASVQPATISCPYKYICGSSQPNAGDVVTAYACGVNVEVPDSFTGVGTYINNQTSGTRAYFKNRSFGVVFTTPGAFYRDDNYNWHPVWYIDAC